MTRRRETPASVALRGVAGTPVRVTWSELYARAEQLASELRRLGVREGDTVCISGRSTYETILVLNAAWLCRAAVSVAPVMASRARSGRELMARARATDARVAYMEEADWESLDPDEDTGAQRLSEATVRRFAEARPVSTDGAFQWPVAGASPDSVAIYQATSGTTVASRIVPVTWRMLTSNVAACAVRLGLGPSDSMVSWLPLYHDMGLIGFYALPHHLGCDLTLIPPQHFARDPLALARAIEERRGTITACPTFGVRLLSLALTRSAEAIDLSSLHTLVCGAEMIDVEACDQLVEAGERHGLHDGVFAFAFGMAEATLAIAITTPAPVEEGTDRAPIAVGDVAEGWIARTGPRAITGPPVDGLDVRVCRIDDPMACPDGEVGEIQVRGSSVMAGYVGMSPTDSGLTEDGWLRTGDLGYVRGGCVVPAGRIKDVIVVGGRNMLADDVEQVVGDLPGLVPGRVAAVSVWGEAGEGLGIVMEDADADALGAAREAVRATLRRDAHGRPHRATGRPAEDHVGESEARRMPGDADIVSQAIDIQFDAFVDQLRSRWSVPLPDGVDQHADLADDLGADSLQVFQLVVLTELLAETTTAPDEVPDLRTLADALAYYRTCCIAPVAREEA